MGVIQKFNKAFENRIRLGIMSILIVNQWVEFNRFKELIDDITDGNLASHLKALEKLDYVEMRKAFIGRKPQTSYKITKTGRKAFKEHLDALEEILKKSK